MNDQNRSLRIQSGTRLRSLTILAAIVFVIPFLTGCGVSYVTPGGVADFSAFGAPPPGAGAAGLDRTVQERLNRKPMAQFPVAIAVARVQAPGYRSYSERGRGVGRYSVVTRRTVEEDEDFDRIGRLAEIHAVAPMNAMLVPHELNTDRELRAAAAALHADMLLLYTFDTDFHVDDTAVQPLGVITLGLFPSKRARVETTASALLMDTRTGYIYGLAEASADGGQIANAWTSRSAVDQTRRRVEREAFENLVADFERAWPQIVAAYRPRGS